MGMELEFADPLAFVDTGEAIMEAPKHTMNRREGAGVLCQRFTPPDAYAGDGLALQYDQADTSRVISPDLFVALSLPEAGLPPIARSWQTWLHGVPTVVIEIVSKSTVGNDQGKKFRVYQSLGVEELFLFDPYHQDPDQSCLPTPLLGFRRSGERLVPLALADGYDSPRLGLRLEVEGDLLRFVDLATGRPIPTSAEARNEAEAARQRVQELEAELERLRGEGG